MPATGSIQEGYGQRYSSKGVRAAGWRGYALIFWLYFYFNGLVGVTMPGFENINRQWL
jgi:hypothetical protein